MQQKNRSLSQLRKIEFKVFNLKFRGIQGLENSKGIHIPKEVPIIFRGATIAKADCYRDGNFIIGVTTIDWGIFKHAYPCAQLMAATKLNWWILKAITIADRNADPEIPPFSKAGFPKESKLWLPNNHQGA